MFGLFKKDPIKQLTEDYKNTLDEAMQAQRNADIRTYCSGLINPETLIGGILPQQEQLADCYHSVVKSVVYFGLSGFGVLMLIVK